MPRPCSPRRVAAPPRCSYFKPAGIPASWVGEVVLSVDGLEALRLADLEGLYQDEAAAQMGVSRPTFARIVESSRRKVAEALVNGHALRIAGGPVALSDHRRFRCEECRHEWSLPFGTRRPNGCPSCASEAFRRLDAGARPASRHRGGSTGRRASRRGGP